MTFGEAKQMIAFNMASDRNIASENMALQIHKALKGVAMLCVPLSLLSKGLGSGDILRFVDDVNYVRVPDMPVEDTDIIDIDPMLENAVVYATCKNLSLVNKLNFDRLMIIEINNFNWAIYEGETNYAMCN